MDALDTCGNKEIFKTIKRIDGGYVIFGDNAKGEVTGVGTITLSSSYDLIEVYLVEGLKHNLLSISQLCDAGFQVTFNIASCIIKHPKKRLTLIRDRVNNIYVLNNVDIPYLTCLTAVTSDPWLWHRKLWHTSMHALEKLSRLEQVIGLPKLKFEKDHVCDACHLCKKTRSFFKGKDNVSTSKPLQLLHMDLFGPTRTAIIGGKRYAFLIVNDFSRFTWVIFLIHKNEAFTNFEVFCRKVQREARYFITTIHSDHGGEFENKAFEDFCAQNGFAQNFSSPRSPQHNEVVERKNRSLQDTTRTMLLDRNLRDHFWAEDVSTACHILNRCLIRPILKKTSYEL